MQREQLVQMPSGWGVLGYAIGREQTVWLGEKRELDRGWLSATLNPGVSNTQKNTELPRHVFCVFCPSPTESSLSGLLKGLANQASYQLGWHRELGSWKTCSNCQWFILIPENPFQVVRRQPSLLQGASSFSNPAAAIAPAKDKEQRFLGTWNDNTHQHLSLRLTKVPTRNQAWRHTPIILVLGRRRQRIIVSVSFLLL